MATAAGSVEVRDAIAQQVEDAVLHKEWLEKILHCHGRRPEAGSDEVAAAYVKRAEHVMQSTPDPDLQGAALILMLRRIGQYEATGLAVAEGYADTLYLGIDRHTLLASMREQRAADGRLAALQNEVNQLALLVSTPSY